MDRDNDWVSAPADYEELIRWYKPYLVNFLGQQGIVESEREDVFMSILEKAIMHGILQQFNAELTFQHAGKEHKANFKGFITSFFKSYVPGWLVRQNNRSRREALICDAPIGSNNDASTGSPAPWVELNGPIQDDHVDDVIAEDTAARFREHLEGLPRRSSGDQLDMVAFFDYRFDQVKRTGKVSNRDVEIHFGRSHTCVNGWTWRLRQEFCTWAGMQLPAKKTSVRTAKVTADSRPRPPAPPCPK